MDASATRWPIEWKIPAVPSQSPSQPWSEAPRAPARLAGGSRGRAASGPLSDEEARHGGELLKGESGVGAWPLQSLNACLQGEPFSRFLVAKVILGLTCPVPLPEVILREAFQPLHRIEWAKNTFHGN